jgi:hypothetical protein
MVDELFRPGFLRSIFFCEANATLADVFFCAIAFLLFKTADLGGPRETGPGLGIYLGNRKWQVKHDKVDNLVLFEAQTRICRA